MEIYDFSTNGFSAYLRKIFTISTITFGRQELRVRLVSAPDTAGIGGAFD